MKLPLMELVINGAHCINDDASMIRWPAIWKLVSNGSLRKLRVEMIGSGMHPIDLEGDPPSFALTKLDISTCHLTVMELTWMLKSCPLLDDLVLIEIEDISLDDFVNAIGQHARRLSNLAIRYDRQPDTPLSRNAVEWPKHLSRLKCLTISDCYLPVPTLMSLPSGLTRLVCHGAKVPSAWINIFLPRHPNLQSIELPSLGARDSYEQELTEVGLLIEGLMSDIC